MQTSGLERLLNLPFVASKKAFEICQENVALNFISDISIDKKILVVGKGALVDEFCRSANDFSITRTDFLENLSGHIGEFRAQIHESSEIVETSQIVLFSAPSCIDMRKNYLGVLFANQFDSKEALISELDSNIGEFTYENTIKYESKKCQFFKREKTAHSICHKCADVCPTHAIIKDEQRRELEFCDIDCISCGKCVSVCPSGAMQKRNATLESISKAARLYDKIPLLISAQDENIDALCEYFERTQNAPFEPFILPNVNMLNEVYLLSICQESGCGAIIFGDCANVVRQSADFANSIYRKIFNKTRVFKAQNIADLDEISCKNLALDSSLKYHYDAREDEFSREIFANRLLFMVKNNDFGNIPNSANIEYSDISIAQNCTLCMSCVEACNTNALISAKDGFEILSKAALCTSCGYCQHVCPEGALKIHSSGIRLKNDYFSYQSKIKDSPFVCAECGKIFASQKSIAKVETIMSQFFGGDEKKMRALRCCSDCKVRVMFKEEIC